MYAYFNNGLSFRAVAHDYVAQTGEVLFADYVSPAQLTSAFTGYAVAVGVQNRIVFVQSAQAALDKSDTTIIRCYSAAIAVPTAWQTYRSALRAIVNGSDTTSQTLPATPSYPSGT